MRVGLLIAVVGLAFGCEYGPEHIPHFQRQIENFESIIDDIETRYGLPKSIPRFRGAIELEGARQRISALDQENQGLQKLVLTLQDELKDFEDEWFKGLDKEQQLQWRMNRELIRAGVRGQVQQTFTRETTTK